MGFYGSWTEHILIISYQDPKWGLRIPLVDHDQQMMSLRLYGVRGGLKKPRPVWSINSVQTGKHYPLISQVAQDFGFCRHATGGPVQRRPATTPQSGRGGRVVPPPPPLAPPSESLPSPLRSARCETIVSQKIAPAGILWDDWESSIIGKNTSQSVVKHKLFR